MSGVIQLGADELSIGERDPSVGIPITRTGDMSRAVNVEFRLDAETATQGADFSASTGVILRATIPAGEPGVIVPVSILDDALSETTETFTISLVNVDSGSLLSPRTARISILDDENPVLPPANPPLVSDYNVSLQPVIQGLVEPIDLEISPTDPSMAYVTTKAGQIYAYNLATGARLSTVLDISAKVNNVQDRGLLDIALHPDFEDNPYIYAFYVVDPPQTAGLSGNAGRDGGGNRFAYLSRFTADAGTDYKSIVAGSEVVLVGGAATSLSQVSGGGAIDSTSSTSTPPSDVNPTTGAMVQNYIKLDSRSHAGGSLAFGPDGKLYVSIGDGTSFNFADPRTITVQNVDSLSGKILRIDPITGNGLTDNPFFEPGDSLSSNSAKVYQLGLRNPFRISFDEHDRLFISDTGWNTYEEIDVGGPGANFGWPYYEGADGGMLPRNNQYAAILPDSADFYAAVDRGDITITAPFRAFHHQGSQPGYQFNVIVGSDGYLDGARYPDSLQDNYLFTNFNRGEVFSVDTNDRQDMSYLFTTASGFGPVQFTNAPDGFVYMTELVAGTISRLSISEKAPTNVLYRWAAGGTTVAAIDGGAAWTTTGAVVTGGPTSVTTAQITSLHASVPSSTTPLGLFSRVRYDPPTGAEMGLEFGAGGLADGDYAVRLFMGNSYAGTSAPGQRQFDVTIEGALAFDNVDLVARFGQRVGGMLEWQGAVTDGTIDIDFRHVVENPLIHGVEILRLASSPPRPTVTVAVAPGSGSEAAGTPLTVTVTASAPVSGAQTVSLARGGAGVTASDFTGTLPTTLTIPNGGTSASVTLNVANDAAAEGPETATFTISAPSSGIVLGGTTTASFAITDNDAAPPTGAVLYRWAAGGTTVAAIDGGPAWTTAGAVVTGGPTSVTTAQITSLHASVPSATTPLGLFSRVRFDPPTGAEMGLEFGAGGLADGDYAVRLFMGNSYAGTSAPGQRQFDVTIEGALAFDNVDLVARFGQRVGGMLEWQGAVTDGTIDIDFRHVVENPLIHGVEILRLPPPTDSVLYRWAAGGTTVAAIDGGPAWTTAGAVVTGGPTSVAAAQITSLHASVPSATTPLGLFSRVRFDPPTGAEMGLEFGAGGLADGDYAVRLFMGNSYAGTSAPGQRQFDVTIEGALAFDNVDLIARFGQRVGGMLEWQGAVTDGTIDIDFRHVIENPLIHGVEILRLEPDALM